MAVKPPIHPGGILNEEFLGLLKITQYRLAQAIVVDARRVHAIILGQRSITAETALQFSSFFGNSPEFWMGIQNRYDLEREQDRLADRLDQAPCTAPKTQSDLPSPKAWLPNGRLFLRVLNAFRHHRSCAHCHQSAGILTPLHRLRQGPSASGRTL